MREEVEEQVLEQELEQVARVAAIDIAKASAMVCTRLPKEGSALGRRVQRVWPVGATTNAIAELADHLVCQQVELVVMEATCDYWRPFFYLLEARGLRCWLVNARDVKNVPGRPKTDKLDAIWLAKLAERGMLRASFVPPEPVRQLRDLTRLRTVLTEDRTRYRSRIEKVLEDAQIKVSSVVSDLFGVSGRAFLAALVAGERSPGALAELARGRLRGKHAALIEALTGRFLEHHAYLIGLLLEDHDRLTAQIDQLTTRIEAAIHEIDPTPPPDDDHPERPGLLARLSEIPGVGPGSAAVIIAEIGVDMGVSPPPATSPPGPSSRRAPSSPARRARTGPPGRATGGSRGTWPRRRSRPHGPRPSSERATGASPNTPRRRKPSSRSPETSSRSPGS